MKMTPNCKTNWIGLSALAAIVAFAPLVAAAGQPSDGAVIDLPAEDRRLLDQYLGKGVVGKAVAGKPITDPLKLMPFKKATWHYRMTYGKQKGQTIKHVYEPLDNGPSGANWKVTTGETDILFFKQTGQGEIDFVRHSELDQGLVVTYLPPDPLVVKGMKPGDTHKAHFDVKVYYLKQPDKLKHSGELDLILQYVGAYQVTTPAGTYEAVLIKSTYNGKIGPAKVEDFQYRLLAEDMGIIAEIEKKDISAFLVYKEHLKVGKVLVEKK